MITELTILDLLENGQISLPPLRTYLKERSPTPSNTSRSSEVDALVEVRWGEQSYTLAAEIKTSNTPKALRSAADRILALAPAFNALPLVIVPWLSPEQLSELEKRQISGIDLCGNGVVVVPAKILVLRTGQPNAYPESRPIRDVYRGDSSIVARTYLLKPRYRSVNDVWDEVRSRLGNVALSTVSKVLKQLEDDLVIAKDGKATRLLQADKLMDNLSASYRPATAKGRFVGRCKPAAASLLAQTAADKGIRVVRTGISSATRYATMGLDPVQAFYCDRDPRTVLEAVGIEAEETERFPNIELIQTEDASVYFDRRVESAGSFASPVQTWLELNAGDKRLREVAGQVKELILRNLAAATAEVADGR
jgi:hypothetical protein